MCDNIHDAVLQLVKKEYCTDSNYKIEYSDGKSSCVAVYFSSNGLFYPDDVDTFTQTILVRDRYELWQNRIDRAHKHIFIRDLYKSWYLLGISSQSPTVESLCEFLRKEVNGYQEVIMVGISSGGYAAILFGSMLKATTILAFSAQWSLYEEDIERKIGRKRGNVDFSKIQQYYNIVSTGNYSQVFYFCPVLSEEDKIQLEYAEKAKNINIIRLAESGHGLAVPLESLQYVLRMSNRKLIELSGERVWEASEFLQKVTPWKVKASRKARHFARCRFSHLYGALKKLKHIVS